MAVPVNFHSHDLGLTPEMGVHLQAIDAAFLHFAWDVNLAAGWAGARDSNLVPLVNILKFLGSGSGKKAMHFASTTDVYGHGEQSLSTTQEQKIGSFQNCSSGYELSKLAGEHLVQSMPIPSAIYRIGMVTDTTSCRSLNFKDELNALVLHIGTSRKISQSLQGIWALPVDSVAATIIANARVLRDRDSAVNSGIFNVSAKAGLARDLLMDTYKSKGLDLSTVSSADWIKTLNDGAIAPYAGGFMYINQQGIFTEKTSGIHHGNFSSTRLEALHLSEGLSSLRWNLTKDHFSAILDRILEEHRKND
jgi:thioester reductase-like protein